jgi:hypothetical protein
MTARVVGSCLGLVKGRCRLGRRDESAVGEAGGAALNVRCPGGTAQRTCRPERRLEGLAVAVLTALGERDSLVRDAERRAAQALRLMTDQEGLSIRDVVEWRGGAITSGGDALAATGQRSATRAIAPRPGVGQGEVLSGRPDTPAFVRSVATLMTSGVARFRFPRQIRGVPLVDGRSRRADGFCSGLRRSVNASRTPCASCGTSAITRCVGSRIVRMWWPGPWTEQ